MLKAKMLWIFNKSNDNCLSVMNYDEYIYMRLPMDKVIKIAPGVLKSESADLKCIDLYLNSNDPVQITHDVFVGMYYVLQNFDMLNYANTALSFMMLMSNPVNRTDFSTPSEPVQTDNSVVHAPKGRTFNTRSKSFFDK